MGKLTVVPKPTLERLFIYYRDLLNIKALDVKVVSSDELGRRLGIDGPQIRKDLSYLNEYGKPRVGYDVDKLLKSLEEFLGLNNANEAVIVGAGRLGTAITTYRGFAKYGFRIVALFDNDPAKVETVVEGRRVFPLDELSHIIKRLNIKLGVITVPADAAQGIADAMVESGIKAIWNFAPIIIKVPENVFVRNEDLAIGLASLSLHVSKADSEVVED